MSKDLSAYSDEELARIANTPQQNDKAGMLSSLSDDELEKIAYGEQPERSALDYVRDPAVALSQGIVDLGSAAVGLADIPTGGRVGKAMKENLGYDPRATNQFLEGLYSPAQQYVNRKVSDAEGFVGTAKEVLSNPSSIAMGAVRSVPSMLGGGAAAQGLTKAGVVASPVIAGAIGEGLIGAGTSAEDVRQEQGTLGPKQIGSVVASGALTGAIGAIGGKIAQRFGFGDPDTMLAAGGLNKTNQGIVKRILGGGMSEGLFEELPQSMQEQIWMNAATDRPLMEGVGAAGAQGGIVGAAVGGAANIPARRVETAKDETPPEAPQEQPVQQDVPKQPVDLGPIPAPQDFKAPVEETQAWTPESFAKSIVDGTNKATPEDQQFYENNKQEIEKYLAREYDSSIQAEKMDETANEQRGNRTLNLGGQQWQTNPVTAETAPAMAESADAKRVSPVNEVPQPETQQQPEPLVQAESPQAPAENKIVDNGQAKFIQERVKALGSIEAVKKAYPGDDAVSQFARTAALSEFATPEEMAQKADANGFILDDGTKVTSTGKAKKPDPRGIERNGFVLDEAEAAGVGKPAYQQTQAEYVQDFLKRNPNATPEYIDEHKRMHRGFVEQAMARGDAVPKAVLDGYQDLRVKASGETLTNSVAKERLAIDKITNAVYSSFEKRKSAIYSGKKSRSRVNIERLARETGLPINVVDTAVGVGTMSSLGGKDSARDAVSNIISQYYSAVTDKNNSAPKVYADGGKFSTRVDNADNFDKKNGMTSRKGSGDTTTENTSLARGGNPFKESIFDEPVYHGGASRIEDFSKGSFRASRIGAAFFTDEKSVAGSYAKTGLPPKSEATEKYDREGYITEAYIDIKNPITDEMGPRDVFDSAEEAYKWLDDFMSQDEAESAKFYLEDGNEDGAWEIIEESEFQHAFAEEAEESFSGHPFLSAIATGLMKYENFRNLIHSKFDGLYFEDSESGGNTIVPFRTDQIKILPNNPSRPGKVGTKNGASTGITTKQSAEEFTKRGFNTSISGDTVTVKTPSGEIRINIADSIVENDSATIRLAYGREAKPGEKVAGSYFDGTVTLKRDLADKYTLSHELYHHMYAAGLFTKAEQSILNRKGDEEAQARWVEDKIRRRGEVKGMIRQIAQKVMDFIDALANVFVRTERGVVRGVESGDILRREPGPKADTGLKLAAKKITDTPAFRKWFGDSKVVDENGEPLVVYHGTASTDIEKFLPDGGRDGQWQKTLDFYRKAKKENRKVGYMNFRSGTFFSPDPEYAGNYTAENTGAMYPVYIKSENPVYFDMKTKRVWGANPEKTMDALILMEDGKINEVSVIDPLQIKSATGNNGQFDPNNPDIRYSTKESKQYDKWQDEIAGQFKANDKPDTTLFDRILSVPLYSFQKVPALKGMFQSGLDWMDNKIRFLRNLMYDENEQAYNAGMEALRKQDKAGHKKWNKWIVDRDVDAIGYRVTDNKGTFELYDPKGKMVATHPNESEAWADARKREADDFIAAGGSKEWAQQIVNYRIVTRNMFKLYRQQVEEMLKRYTENGEKPPEVVYKTESGEVKISLQAALAKMGDRQGYYMPRLRSQGRLKLVATKNGENSQMKFFDLGAMNTKKSLAKSIMNYPLPVMREFRKWKKQGYEVTITQADKLPEDVWLDLAGQRIAMEQIINRGLSKIGDLGGFGLKDMGISGKVEENGDYVVTGFPEKEIYKKILEDLGGKFDYSVYATKGGKSSALKWTFKNPKGDIEKQILEVVREETNAGADLGMLFAGELANQIATLEKSRGSRSRMIGRNDAKGKDVWKGYEEDAIIALTKAAQGAAGGEAKKVLAESMLRHFTGTQETWREYKERMKSEGNDAVWDEYKTEKDKRSIDAAKQPNAYKEGRSFMENMLRNDEAIDRYFGAVRGLASLKYLGFRVAAPAVNLTALMTTVPATFAKNGLSLSSTPVYLGKAMKSYYDYKRGKADNEWKLIFDEIERNGWHKAQYNKEALSILKSKAGRGFDQVSEWSMWLFGATEQLNRVSTIAGAAKAFMDKQGMTLQDALLKAKEDVSDKAHGVYGKINMPMAGRGSGVGNQAFRSFYMFRTFSHNYLLNLAEMVGQGNVKAAVFMTLSPAILAGAGASVATPLLASIGKLFGYDDPEEEFYRWAEDTFGETGGGFARYGMTYPAGVNLKGSLSIGITDLPTSFKDILGAPASVFADIFDGGKSILKGEVWKGTERAFPINAVGNAMRSWREYNEGATTRTNTPIFYGDEQLRPSGMEAVLRSLFSFNTTGMATKKEKQWKERKLDETYRNRMTDIYSRVRKFYAQPYSERNRADWMEIIADIEEYNARAKKAFTYIPVINSRSIKTALKQKPPKRERMRQ